MAIYINVARVFYSFGLTGTIAGVVLVHAAHGLVYSVWIAAAAFRGGRPRPREAARNIGASPLRTFATVTLPLAAPGIMASAIFVFLESLDEFTGTFFVGVPQVTTLPLLLYSASMGGNYQIASITALILLVPRCSSCSSSKVLREAHSVFVVCAIAFGWLPSLPGMRHLCIGGACRGCR